MPAQAVGCGSSGVLASRRIEAVVSQLQMSVLIVLSLYAIEEQLERMGVCP